MGRALLAALLAWPIASAAQEVRLEYQVKAAYLYNFMKFVEWPAGSGGPLTICVAGRNPFGSVLADTVRGELIEGRPIEIKVILEPEPGCHAVFVPRTAAVTAYLRAAQGTPTLTVGESPRFIEQGGIINFFLEGSNVRFQINPSAAERARLRISSRLLQLARLTASTSSR